MLVSEDDVTAALAILSDETGAAARAANEYLDALTKSVLAELILDSNETSQAAKEVWGRAQPKFKEHLARVVKAARLDYEWRQRYSAASAKIECWRTENANQRAAERIR